MRILLTGATGFLGYRTLEKLSFQSNIDLIIANGRKIVNSHFLEHSKVKYQLGDLTNKNFVDQIVEDIDVIIHVAALSSPWGRYSEFKRANVVTQKNLIEAANRYSVSRYVYISTPSIYFELKDKFNIKESDPLPRKFINAYAESKREAEILLENSNLPYVILRPRAIIGRGDTVIMPRLIRAFDERKLKIMGDGQNSVDLTSVGNVVDAIILALNTKKGINQTYNITNGDPVNLWDSISYVLSELGKDLSEKKIPFLMVKQVAKIMEFKSRITNMNEPVLTLYGVGTLTKSFTMNIDKAKDLLGYSPKISTKEAIDEFVQWYLKENKK